MANALTALLLTVGAQLVRAVNFPFEAVQLADADATGYPAVAFGNASAVPAKYSGPRCKVGPGDAGWPSDQEWATFNKSLSGRLLKPAPAGAVCYPGPLYNKDRCEFVAGPAANTRFFLDDPLNMMTSWVEGNSCPPIVNATGTCTQGGFPVYVVNATTVKDVQMTVNFARNKNLRLIVRWAAASGSRKDAQTS